VTKIPGWDEIQSEFNDPKAQALVAAVWKAMTDLHLEASPNEGMRPETPTVALLYILAVLHEADPSLETNRDIRLHVEHLGTQLHAMMRAARQARQTSGEGLLESWGGVITPEGHGTLQ
jgi:hypothetical protein